MTDSPPDVELEGTALAAAIVAHSDDAIIAKRLDGTIIAWNTSAERIFGYSAAEMIGQPITRLFPANRLHEEAMLIAQLVKGHAISHFETERVRKDGSIVSISATLSPVRDRRGAIVAISKVARDISAWKAMRTELDRVTADLAKSATRFQQLYEATPAMLHSIDASGCLLAVSGHWLSKLGYSRSEVLGRPLADFLTAASQEVLRNEHLGAFRAGRDAVHLDYQMICKDARLLDVELSAIAERDAEGRFFKGMAVIEDVTARKAAQAALRTSEAYLERTAAQLLDQHELLRVTLDSIGDAVITTDAQGSVQWLNSVAAGLIGWPRAEAPGQSLATLFHIVDERTRQRTANPATRALTGDCPVSATDSTVLIARDGTEYGIEWSAAPIRDKRGAGLGAVLVFHDVSERHKAAAALRVANERLAMATDAAAIGIWELILPANAVHCDREMCRIYGVPAGGLDSLERWEQLLHPDDRTRTLAALASALSGESDYDTEFRIVRPGGELRYVKAAGRVQRNPLGAPSLMVGINLDITERKEAEIEQKNTSSLLQLVLDSATDLSIIATTPDLTINIFSKGAERMLGYASSEVVGLTTPAIIHDSFEVAARAAELTEAAGRPVVGTAVFTDPFGLNRAHEWTYIRKDRRRVPVSLVCSAMRSHSGALTGYLGVAHDITQAREHEGALQAAMARAEAANAAKSQFLANMSHEIRTPLNAVIGLGYLLEQTPLTDEQRSFLSKIQFAGRSLLGVVNNILDLSKIEAGEMTLEDERFDVVGLAQQVGQMLAPEAQAKGIELLVRPASELPRWVRGDATRLRQVLTNLLNNAIKFTEKGCVDLALSLLEQAGTGIRLRCVVSDTGIGIAPAGVARLFAPFAQADASTTRRFGGTGLGLSIARRFVELMGGEIGVTSDVGVGSRFWIEITLRTAEQAGADYAAHDGRPLRLLIVEPADAIPALQSIIRPLGWLPHSVTNAEGAVSWLRDADRDGWPDVILIDGSVRGMTPIQCISRLRREFPHLELPPIIVADDELLHDPHREPLRQAASVILTRPLSGSSVFNAVNTALAVRNKNHDSALQATNFDQVFAQWLCGAKLLVVDDSEVNRTVALHVLQKQGAIVTTCEDGAAAVERLRHEPDAFDVVLMDVQMPHLDGNQATQKIRNDLGLRALPIIALTAGALVSERERALEAGMNAFLSKPLEPAALIRVVRRFVEQKRGATLPVGIVDNARRHDGVAAGLTSIDPKFVQHMFGDDEDLFASLLNRVLREFGALALPIAVEGHDAAARARLVAQLHKLRGSAGVIGAKTVEQLAAASERALADAAPPEFVDAILRQLAAALTALAEEGRPLLDRLTAKNADAASLADVADPAEKIAELLDLLDNHDLDAMERFGMVAPALRASLGGVRFGHLKDAVEALDFCQAAILLRDGAPQSARDAAG